MSEPRECIEVGICDLGVTIRIEDSLYYWTSSNSPGLTGLHREIARAVLNNALASLDAEWETS